MTYLQRAEKDGKTKAPFYYAVSERKTKRVNLKHFAFIHTVLTFIF